MAIWNYLRNWMTMKDMMHLFVVLKENAYTVYISLILFINLSHSPEIFIVYLSTTWEDLSLIKILPFLSGS